ncbi:RNA polymerase sigma-70 factor [Arenibacter sp. BSSL-BM3]|uniref:RNA polymerase sigma-70 factor n=1 Tax=Arenibacter arenosicollis TaxID=2762274 RepID=A0ABR7QKK2_9FLAO|nr:RNA polymerase sigma-70 factor [Arenibacter arenosicollis]MBC8767710.1 RNA polymerase sigma-70 factor [Arenibacter arenosicollis]
MSEEEIWECIQQNDNHALKKLFDLHYRRLCIYALQFSCRLPDAEDMVQTVFIKLWTKRNELSINTSLKAYLYRSVYNECMQSVRKIKNQEKSVDDIKYEMLQSQIEEDMSFEQDKIDKIQSLIAELPARCREILLLSKKEGLKNKEIAEKLGISIKTVESQMGIAFKKIRQGFVNEELILFIYFHTRCIDI